LVRPLARTPEDAALAAAAVAAAALLPSNPLLVQAAFTFFPSYPMGLNPFPGYFGVPPPQYAPALKSSHQSARGMTSAGQGFSTRLVSTQQASGASALFMG